MSGHIAPRAPQAEGPPGGGSLPDRKIYGRIYGGLSTAERDAQRRENLLDAGLELFGTKGFAATRMTDIAEHAQIAFRYVARLFPDKESLLEAVFSRVQDQVLHAVAAARADAAPTLTAQIRASLRAAMFTYGSDPRAVRISCLEVVGINRRLEALRRQTSVRFVDQLVAGLDTAAQAGCTLPSDYALLGVGLVGGVGALLADWALCPPGSRASLDELAEAASRIYLRTLGLPER